MAWPIPPPKNQRTQKNTRAHRRAQKSQPNIADHAQRNRAHNQTHQGLSPLRTESPSPPRRCFARCQTRLSRSRQDCRALESPTLQRSGLRLNPASDVIPRSINPRAIPLDDIRNLPWDELLHMLSRARIVARIRDGRAQTVHANPCLHQHVFGSLRGGMWRAWAIERIFRKAQQAVQCEIAIDFVRGNVVEVRIMMPRRPKKHIGLAHVRTKEGFLIQYRAAIARLGRKMHTRIRPGHEVVNLIPIADITNEHLDPPRRYTCQVSRICRVSKHIQHKHADTRMLSDYPSDEVRPHKP